MKLLTKELNNENVTSTIDTADLLVDDYSQEARKETFVTTQSTIEHENLTFYPIVSSTLSTTVALTIKATTEEVFTFHPLITTQNYSFVASTERHNDGTRTSTASSEINLTSSSTLISVVTTQKSNNDVTNVQTVLSSETTSFESTTQPTVTNFLPDNTKNVLSSPTEQPESTSQRRPSSDNEPIVTTKKSLNSNEIDDDKADNEDKKVMSEAPVEVTEHEQSVDNIENIFFTESNPTINDVHESTQSVLITHLLTTVSSSKTTNVDRNAIESTSVDPKQFSESMLDVDKSTETSSHVTQTEKSLSLNDESIINYDLLNDPINSQASNSTRKIRLRNFFYYYFINAFKANESRARETNKTFEGHNDEARNESFLGLPGDQSLY